MEKKHWENYKKTVQPDGKRAPLRLARPGRLRAPIEVGTQTLMADSLSATLSYENNIGKHPLEPL